MGAIKTLFVAATFLLLSGPLSTQANLIWNWTGTCITTCQGEATMHVVMPDTYVPGTGIGPQDSGIIEALYVDSNVGYDFGGFRWTFVGEGALWPAESGAAAGGITIQEDRFRTFSDGTWNIGGQGIPGHELGCGQPPGVFCTYVAGGIDGVWTRVPEPSTLALLGIGLTGLTFLRRHRGDIVSSEWLTKLPN